MMIGIAAVTLLLGVAQQTDSTFAVRGGGRLDLDAHDGAVVVRVWDREQMRVQATHNSRVELSIRRSNTGVSIEAESRGGPARGVRFEITVPRAYNIAIDGINIATTIEGVQGNVAVENVEGAVTIRDVAGSVTIESVSGSVIVQNVRGNVSASSTNQSVLLTNIRGNIQAETNNGSIVMRGIESSLVEATTINGILEYDGTVLDGGRYYLGAHNGQITMSVPERASATISVKTSNGRIVSAFPVPMRSSRENRVSFTVGSGSASVEIKSHNGTIHLVRPRGR